MSSLPFETDIAFNLTATNPISLTVENSRATWASKTLTECEDGILWQCPVFQTQYELGNQKFKQEYDIQTLDMILGVIGGFAGLVWQFFGLITADYEEFKKNVSLLKSFYTVD